MKKIYTLFFSLFLFASISAFAQTKEQAIAISDRRAKEVQTALELSDAQQKSLTSLFAKYEENRLDYENVDNTNFSKSKLSVMRENYASELVPGIKEILTFDQFNMFLRLALPE